MGDSSPLVDACSAARSFCWHQHIRRGSAFPQAPSQGSEGLTLTLERCITSSLAPSGVEWAALTGTRTTGDVPPCARDPGHDRPRAAHPAPERAGLNACAVLPRSAPQAHPGPMRRIVALPLLVLGTLAGCGGGGDEAPQWCAEPAGLYEVTLTMESGNCLDAPLKFIANFSDTSSVEACTGTRMASANNCELYVDRTCPAIEGGGTTKTTGKVTWNEDASRGVGKLSMSINPASGASCHALFFVTYVRL